MTDIVKKMKNVWSVSRLTFADGRPVLAPFVGTTMLSALNCLCSFVKDQLTVFVWVCFWVLYSVPFICVSTLLPVSCCPDDCSFMVSLEVW